MKVYDSEKRGQYGEEFLKLIQHIRSIRKKVDSPALESCLREMEYANYVALMYLGIEDSVSPETWDEIPVTSNL